MSSDTIRGGIPAPTPEELETDIVALYYSLPRAGVVDACFAALTAIRLLHAERQQVAALRAALEKLLSRNHCHRTAFPFSEKPCGKCDICFAAAALAPKKKSTRSSPHDI